MKTHAIFSAVKTVFSRQSDLINSNLDRKLKARKLIVKIVNALTANSETGAPMASMYLLKHPDHYTSHKFCRFYWRSFVNAVDRVWKSETSELIDHNANDNVMLWK